MDAAPHWSEQIARTVTEESAERRRARSRLELAAAYFESGRSDIALQELRQSLAADPTYAPAWNLSGLLHMRLAEYRPAEDAFRKAIALDPRDSQVQHNLGWLLCQQARYAESFDWFDRVSMDPHYSERAKTHRAWGLCAAKAGRHELARDQLQQSQRLDPANPVTRFYLAQALLAAGQADAARVQARSLNNSDFANAESLWLGVKLERLLHEPLAMDQLAEQLLRRYPDSREAAALQRRAFDE